MKFAAKKHLAAKLLFELLSAMRLMRYQEAMAAIITILVLVILSEKISDHLRKVIIGQELLR
jgi:ABC-type phosphate/phosphonate transport system permease subunit